MKELNNVLKKEQHDTFEAFAKSEMTLWNYLGDKVGKNDVFIHQIYDNNTIKSRIYDKFYPLITGLGVQFKSIDLLQFVKIPKLIEKGMDFMTTNQQINVIYLLNDVKINGVLTPSGTTIIQKDGEDENNINIQSDGSESVNFIWLVLGKINS
ncbi:hypothetical protein BPT24_248 [Tenacibaculum phage pT24]|uniref:Uncharacterized protein n=1 Tax=Tenacibaculum phage pT24 TaxID=1880590 RepID=A0A1B4XX44_9CAUD|nr:hypothetical protein HYP10_gp280 [Tenacibaculum phage pT24]BAV39368.1 hypothetical protein BPT24_248 [Tenacibaculum phage pT24]